MRLSKPGTSLGRIGLFVFVFVAPVLAFPLVSQQQVPEPHLLSMGKAEQLLREGKPTEALDEIERVIDVDENFADAWYFGGVALGQLKRFAEARDYFVRASELNPGWGEAHRYASMASADIGDLEASWEHAIKAHQAGLDMSDAFAGLRNMSRVPDDLDDQLGAARVFVGGFDTSVFDRDGSRAGAKAVLAQAAADLFSFQQVARETLSESAAFGLVQRQESAQYIMMFEIETLTDTLNGSRRRLSGVLRLVDARSGETVNRRRIDFADINSLSYLNREWRRIVGLLEEWAAERGG